jgi:hypothetical protein
MINDFFQALPVDVVIETVIVCGKDDLGDYFPGFQSDAAACKADSAQALFHLISAYGADRCLQILPLSKSFRKSRAGGDIELNAFLFAQRLDLSAVAPQTLCTDDPILFGKLGWTFLIDQAMREENGNVTERRLVKVFTVIVIDEFNNVIAETGPFHQRLQGIEQHTEDEFGLFKGFSHKRYWRHSGFLLQ